MTTKISAIFIGLCLLLTSQNAQAANQVSASFRWTVKQLSKLRFTKDDKPIHFRSGRVILKFSDPRKHNEIEKILVHPTYRPGTPKYADFFTTTTITLPGSHKRVSETALCYWNKGKKTAKCSIEDDGGRFQIRVVKRASTLKRSRFSFVVLRLDGYRGFRIGAYERPDGVHSVDVTLKGSAPVIAKIAF